MTPTTSRPSSGTRRAAVLRLLSVGFAASLGMGLVFSTPAQAARVRDTLDLRCDTLGAVTVTVSGNGPYAPGLVVDGTTVGIPYALTFTTTFTPTGGEPQTVVESYGKRPPAHGRLDRCVFSQESTDASGTLSLVGEVLISYTAR